MFTSADEFVSLLGSEDAGERERYRSDELPVDVCLEIINRYPEYRDAVVSNKTVPIEILVLLSDDPDPWIRSHVASKRKLTSELFERLARDEDSSVRARIACNAKVPLEVLEMLTHDECWIVSEPACERFKRRTDSATHP